MGRYWSDRKCVSGVVACIMAYVVVLQVTLALTLNASMAAGLFLGFDDICLSSATAGAPVDQSHDDSAQLPLRKGAHCPLCVAPAFGLLPQPTSPAILVRLALGVAFEAAAPEPIHIAEVTSPHRARAPPVRA